MAVVVNAGQNPFLELLSRIQGFNAQPPASVQAPPVVRPLAMPQVPAIQHSPEVANAVGNFIQSLAPKPVAAPVMEPIGLVPAGMAQPLAGRQLGVVPTAGGTAPSGAGGASIGIGPMAMPTSGLSERRLTRPL